MIQRYVVQESKSFVPWLLDVRSHRETAVRVQLFERSSSPQPQLVGIWDFGGLDGQCEGLEIDLWTIELQSVRIKTSRGIRLAQTYHRERNVGLSDRIGLMVVSLVPPSAGYKLLEAELVLSQQELSALKTRLRSSEVPPIEWFFVELTNECNFGCGFCPKHRMERPRGMMSLDRAKWLMEQIAEYRRHHPLFSLYAEIRNPVFLHVMGEPLLHPNLFDIVAHGQEQGLDFCLVTNASLLKGRMVQHLLDSGIKSVVLSLNAPDAESFGHTGSAVPYEQIVARMQEFIAQRYTRGTVLPRIEIQLLNTRGVQLPNCPQVEQPQQVESQLIFWTDFVREQQRLSSKIPYLKESGDPSRWRTILEHESNEPEMYFSLGRNVWLVFKRACNFANFLLPDGWSVRETSRGTCAFRNPYRTLCVLWDGSCTFCSLDFDNEANLGNVFNGSIEDIWAGEPLRRIRGLMDYGILAQPICRRCMGAVVPSDMA